MCMWGKRGHFLPVLSLSLSLALLDGEAKKRSRGTRNRSRSTQNTSERSGRRRRKQSRGGQRERGMNSTRCGAKKERKKEKKERKEGREGGGEPRGVGGRLGLSFLQIPRQIQPPISCHRLQRWGHFGMRLVEGKRTWA